MGTLAVVFLVIAVLAFIFGVVVAFLPGGDDFDDGCLYVGGVFLVSVIACCCAGSLMDFQRMCESGGSYVLPALGVC